MLAAADSAVSIKGSLSECFISKLVVAPGALRLIFAATVVIAHYALLSGHALPAPIDGVAVNGFFVLSGYWIARLWDNTYSKLPAPISTFYVSRAWRIYPLAVIGTLAMLPLVDYHVGGSTLGPNLALFTLRMQWPVLNPPEWSLAIELQFYLLAPLLLLLTRQAKWVWALLAVGTVFWLRFTFEHGDTWLPVYLVFFLGGILYARHPLPQTAERFALGGLVAFLVFGVLANALPALATGKTYLRFYILALTLAIVPYTALNVEKTSSKPDRVLGDLAFPVYIAHWPVFAVMSALTAHWVAPAIAATALVSMGLWAFVDRPLERLRRAFVASRRTRTTLSLDAYNAALSTQSSASSRVRRRLRPA